MNINALVIEDERADVVVIQQTLAITSAGSFHVEYVTSLADGVDRLARGGIDVVLLDLSLPDSEGSGTLTTLQSAAPQVPVLVVGGTSRQSGHTDELAFGARQFILQDRIDCHRLAHVLRAVIRRGPLVDVLDGRRPSLQ
ncbi:MAG TPA: response regulator [Ideonella sp.]|uniref:response regulator n=1 Tax=Ideonella sp. TaxID=1929293 RepID=UPI002E2F0CB2|nr:response regulator [Ideonella sp.]HEX5682621.1 response regulator [Ideonella sp.]